MKVTFATMQSLLLILLPPAVQKHDPPTSSIPCLHYKKMKIHEEKELNGNVMPNAEVTPNTEVYSIAEVSPNAEVSPAKTNDEATDDVAAMAVAINNNGGEAMEEPDSTAQEEMAPEQQQEEGEQVKVVPIACPRPKGFPVFEGGQGALGQVTTKVEVCKDESIGTTPSL